jgi:hypothetical protein
VKSSSLALDRNGRPVQAYFNLGANETGSDSVIEAYRYKGSGSLVHEGDWTALAPIATGVDPVLASGGAGLFLVSRDTAPGASVPTLLDIRRDDGTSFGPPVTFAEDSDAELFSAGAAAESPGGRLAILWPGARTGDGLKVMRLFSSADGGASFAESDVATVADGYLPDRNAQAEVGEDGQGLVTYIDDGGLEVADFSPIAPFTPAPPATKVPPPPVLHGPVFDPARGPFARTSVRVHGGVVTLRTPRGCVRSGDIVARLSVRSPKHNGHPVIKLLKARFRFDGRLVRTHQRFSARFHVTVAPGTRHTLSARVVIKTRDGQITRTLRNSFTACSA